ncbi:unnamed protein product [Acanthoscelides obtectus]|uniref:Uncharacterized protein n=1 Tax=Acanthoscelides obtectus TaxID=200917 RepID=A0A9P0KHJ4_ACAOB|nr:unnamed protein product [Acanthoscelides obtectus]CAK1680375.1 hypothetical protein AOBTE_LOCUS32604 [Acanthoscelides obtectus]
MEQISQILPEDIVSLYRLCLTTTYFTWNNTIYEQTQGGYYIIERKTLKLQIVVLNTNLMKRSDQDEDAARQWEWLERVLQKFQRNGETVPYWKKPTERDHLKFNRRTQFKLFILDVTPLTLKQ